LLKKLYISLIAVAFAFAAEARTGPPIQACVGGQSVFAVTGGPNSTLRFEITDGNGVVIDSRNNDSIVVQWGMQQGLMQLSVHETFDEWSDWVRREMGIGLFDIPRECQGDTVSIWVDLRGRPFHFEQSSIAVSSGANPNDVIEISHRLYKNVTWFDSDGNEIQRFNRPGIFKVRVEDMHGCTFTDTIEITLTGSTP